MLKRQKKELTERKDEYCMGVFFLSTRIKQFCANVALTLCSIKVVNFHIMKLQHARLHPQTVAPFHSYNPLYKTLSWEHQERGEIGFFCTCISIMVYSFFFFWGDKRYISNFLTFLYTLFFDQSPCWLLKKKKIELECCFEIHEKYVTAPPVDS